MASETLSRTSESYDTDVRVEMGEWAEGHQGQFMETIGLGPCIGLAMYDPMRKIGYMAHTCGPETSTIIDLLDVAAENILNISRIKVWLSGGQLDLKDLGPDDTYYSSIREDVLSLLTGFGIKPKNLTVAWVNNSNQMAHIFLDCGTGKGNIEIEEQPEYYGFQDIDRYFQYS